MRPYVLLLATSLSLAVAACGDSGGSKHTGVNPPPSGPTPQATCGPGSNPETGMQGRVSRADHESGRAARGYNCNTELLGSFSTGNPNGTIGGFKVLRYTDKAGRECAYYDSTLLYPTNVADGTTGVMVLDMSNPAQPLLSTRLLTTAMNTPHESLVLSEQAGVLVAVMGNPGFAPGNIDVYNLEPNCLTPQLAGTGPAGVLGHESGISPDGKTFFSASPGTPTLTAVDISNPLLPTPIWRGDYTSHGLSISNDGNRAYLSASQDQGVVILDISQIQSRQANPQVREISRITWPNKTIPQNAIPFTRNGKPYLMEIDEYSADEAGNLAAHGIRVGAARIIDIADETKPVVVSNMRLAVHEPENRAAIANDPGAQLQPQGYAGHYCNIPTRVNPDIVACSMIVSGLRIFDIRDPLNPKEVAYFNAPVKPRVTPGLEASNWAMSSPAFVPERKEIWYTDGFAGFYAVRVTNGAW